MKVARAASNIRATRKEEKLAGLKPLLAQPLDVLTGKAERPPVVAADTIGADVGETVLVVRGGSVHDAAGDMSILADTIVVGIVGDQEIDRSVLP